MMKSLFTNNTTLNSSYNWMLLFLFVMTSTLFSSIVHAKMTIIKMNYVPAQNVISIIKPHLKPETKITAKDNNLFIEADESDLKKIHSMLTMLDKKPEQYLVEVKITQRKMEESERQQTSISVNADHQQPVSANVKVYRSDSLSNSDKHFSVRATEGYQAFINTGEAFPTHQMVKHYDSFIPKTQYKKVSSGFYVVIRETGEQRVRIQFSGQNQQRKRNSDQTIEESSTNNIVTGKLGEWILLAASEQNTKSNHNKSYSTQNSRSNNQWYYIKVNQSL